MTDYSSKKEIKKVLREANETLRLATKVYHYKKDLLSEENCQRLLQQRSCLREAIHQNPLKSEEICGTLANLKLLLKKIGGTFYPRTAWSENVEMFLVAALLAIGIRMYFLQPFKIPTNSMYPTYNGITYEVYNDPIPPPHPIHRVSRKIQLWNKFYQLQAPSDGAVFIPLNFQSNGVYDLVSLDYKRVKSRKWIFLPTTQRQYTFFVGKAFTPVSVKLPSEFAGFDRLIRETFFSNATDWIQSEKIVQHNGKSYLRLHKEVKTGDNLLTFEIFTGDTLFVDRFSYHFLKPKKGDPFVFQTDNIPGIKKLHGNEGKYYIKRLAGSPGDALEIRDKALYVNDKPATGAKAFIENAKRQDDYEGYVAVGNLSEGKIVHLPEDYFYALGDNSDQSSDSRSWGAVPQKAIVGKAAFIFYPFTSRWGIAE